MSLTDQASAKTISPLCRISNLSVVYGGEPALLEVNLELFAGQFAAVIGPNGAGKSTLLKAILGLIEINMGKVNCDLGSRPQAEIAYVPQSHAIDWGFPLLVHEVVMMGRIRSRARFSSTGKGDRTLVAEALNATGLSSLAQRPISALSGGQKQRVLIARMLVREAKMLLLDEPFTGVDVTTQHDIFELLERERKNGKAILMVTHDLEAAARWCNPLVLLNQTVIAVGSANEVYTAQNIEQTFSRSKLSHIHVQA